MTSHQELDVQEALDLYEKYVKPIEGQHRGEYVAVAPDGRMVFGASDVDTSERASLFLGSDNVLFKVGDIVLGKWRRRVHG